MENLHFVDCEAYHDPYSGKNIEVTAEAEKWEVNRDLMFGVVGSVMQTWPLESWEFKEVKTYPAKRFKQFYIRHFLSGYLSRHSLPKNTTLAYERIRTNLVKEANRAFRIITGHTWTSARKLAIGKAVIRYGFLESRVWEYYFTIARRPIRDSGDFEFGIHPEITQKLHDENRPLFYFCVYKFPHIKPDNLNYFSQCKQEFLKWGMSKADWKFLTKQSMAWVTAFYKHRIRMNPQVFRVRYSYLKNEFYKTFMHLTFTTRLYGAASERYREENKSVLYQKLYNAIQEHEKNKGKIKHFRPFSPDLIRAVLDYALRDDANLNGTLLDIRRRSDDWHFMEGQAAQKLANRELIHFDYSEKDLPLTVEDDEGLLLTLITDSEKLWEEGQSMHHCVGGYARACNRGDYAVYQVWDDKTGTRATLGLLIREPSEASLARLAHHMADLFQREERNDRAERSITIEMTTQPVKEVEPKAKCAVHFDQCYSFCNTQIDKALKDRIMAALRKVEGIYVYSV